MKNKHGYACYDKDNSMPIAAAIERILRDTGDQDRARHLFSQAIKHGLFDVDGHVRIYEKVACIELLQSAALGYKDFQPPTPTWRQP
tara:strand:+ start:1811 stop:2071 length:261 start_codon:yes stop_codon:yes gene_type:complete